MKFHTRWKGGDSRLRLGSVGTREKERGDGRGSRFYPAGCTLDEREKKRGSK